MNQHFVSLIIFAICFFYDCNAQNNFLKEQLSYSRVRTAKAEKNDILQKEFEAQNLQFPPKNIFLRAFKNEEIIEVWVKENDKYQLFKSYDFCFASGTLGPKREQGDEQVPEGFYFIDRFNPSSNFYLSLGINYPNKSDKMLGNKNRLGGDIFIHGNCVSIGCIAITDEKIKELYWLAVLAKNNAQQKIPVHIFPFDLGNNYKWNKCLKEYPQQKSFWQSLKTGFLLFEKEGEIYFE